MALDLQAWVDDPAFAFTDEEKVDVLARFSTDDRRKALEGNQLRLSDYSKKMNDGQAQVAAAQKKVDEADAKLNRELAEWSKVQGASTAAQAAADTRANALEQKLLTARQTVERIAQAAGVDAAEYLKGLEASAQPPADPTPQAPAAADPPDLSGYVKTADVATVNRMLHANPFELQTLSNEHLVLTGQPLDAMALHAEVVRRADAKEDISSLRAVWETLHDIPTKRTAAADVAAKTRDEQNFQRGREAALSEQTLPVGAPAGQHAVIFQADGDGKPHESKLERPQPNVRTQSAVQALVAGKYRVEGAAPGTATAPGG